MGGRNWVERLSTFGDKMKGIKPGDASGNISAFDYNAKLVPVTIYEQICSGTSPIEH